MKPDIRQPDVTRPDAAPPAIRCTGLAKAYRRTPALYPLDLAVPSGGVTAVIGRNGAGKSTLIRLLMGLESPTLGSATVLGRDTTRLDPATRARVGYLVEGHPTHGWMTVEEIRRFEKAYRPDWDDAIFERVRTHFDLASDRKAGRLSRGQRGGLMLGLALAARPELLVMDDPSLGLDPVAQAALREAILLATRAPSRTVLLTTHDLADVERLADRVALFRGGRLVYWGSVDALRTDHGSFEAAVVARMGGERNGLLGDAA